MSGSEQPDAFEAILRDGGAAPLRADDIQVLQVNVGLVCNQACSHCHLRASPRRAEQMPWPVMETAVEAACMVKPGVVDITGGAPEMNPNLRRFVIALRERQLPVQVRTNLTVLLEEGMRDLPSFYSRHGVRLVGSMPCYLEENVRSQRGEGVYEGSVEAVRRLNEVGYGDELPLDLVYNPAGPFLPPSQSELEGDYRRQLSRRFGIRFSRLLTITNMPLGRFAETLRDRGEVESYMQLLRDSFNPATIDALMCRHQVAVGWDGTLYDCDFNLALSWPVDHGAPNHVRDFDPEALACRRIRTGRHCFGCTAGHGSSCRGALD